MSFWVRFPKHIPLSQLDSVGLGDFYSLIQMVVSENLRLSKRLTYNYARIERGYD